MVVTGGLGEVMAAACRGAKAAGGTTIGIVPGESRAAANPWVDHVVATGIGHARNLAVVASGDVVIAVGGRWGTLAEIAFARVLARPVVVLEPGWAVEGDGVERADVSGRRCRTRAPARGRLVELGQAAGEEAPLRLARRELERLPVRGRRLVGALEPSEQIGAGGVEEVVGAELVAEGVEELEALGGTLGQGDRHRAVQLRPRATGPALRARA